MLKMKEVKKMNKSKSYFLIKNPKQNENITENGLINNLNQLSMEGKILQEPINEYIGKGYSYQTLQNRLEIDGYLNIVQVTEVEDIKQGVREQAGLTVSSARSIFQNHPTASMDEIYADALCQNLVEAIKNKSDLTNCLAALEEYNILTQRKDLIKEQDKEESISPKM